MTKKDGGDDREIPASRRTSDIVDKMQTTNAQVFNPRASFDGVKNLFSTKKMADGTVSFLGPPFPDIN